MMKLGCSVMSFARKALISGSTSFGCGVQILVHMYVMDLGYSLCILHFY